MSWSKSKGTVSTFILPNLSLLPKSKMTATGNLASGQIKNIPALELNSTGNMNFNNCLSVCINKIMDSLCNTVVAC